MSARPTSAQSTGGSFRLPDGGRIERGQSLSFRFDGRLYGVYYKVANKSVIWYRAGAFAEAGVSPPRTWPLPPGAKPGCWIRPVVCP